MNGGAYREVNARWKATPKLFEWPKRHACPLRPRSVPQLGTDCREQIHSKRVSSISFKADAKTSNFLEKIPSSTCGVSLVNGGNCVLATPTACKSVPVASMTIAVSAKSCAESTQADFSDPTNTTLFKGDFGFYLGQDKPARCLVVREMWGRYV